MPFWKKKVKEEKEPDPIIEVIEEVVQRKDFSLEGIFSSTRMNEKKIDYYKEKREYFFEQMEKNDPFDLPENVSDEKYERVSDKQDFYSMRWEQENDAISLFEKAGPIPKYLITFNPPMDLKFEYHKTPSDVSNRSVHLLAYGVTKYNLSIQAVEIDSKTEKTFLIERMRKVQFNGKEVSDFSKELKNMVNDNIYSFFEESGIDIETL